jgi:hypothetical protein
MEHRADDIQAAMLFAADMTDDQFVLVAQEST